MFHELPLVLFTIAAQMSAGSVIVLGLIHVLGRRHSSEIMDKVTDPALYAVGPLLVLGLAASTLHLGSPLRAANALRHIDGSWLSREILFGLLFAAFGALFALLQFFKKGSPVLRQALAAITAVLGIVLVYAISQVYSLRTVPAWATWHTPARFFMTTLLLGGLAVAAALVIAAFVRRRRGQELDTEAVTLLERSVQGIAFGTVVVLGAKLVGIPLYLGHLANHASGAAHESLHRMTDVFGGWFTAQSVLSVIGMVLLGALLFLFGRAKGRRSMPTLAVSAFVVILAAEFIGRMLFYATMVRVGS